MATALEENAISTANRRAHTFIASRRLFVTLCCTPSLPPVPALACRPLIVPLLESNSNRGCVHAVLQQHCQDCYSWVWGLSARKAPERCLWLLREHGVCDFTWRVHCKRIGLPQVYKVFHIPYLLFPIRDLQRDREAHCMAMPIAPDFD